MRIRFKPLEIGSFMRDQEIGMTHMLYREDDGAVIGYVRREETAREISRSSGVVEPE